jgi:hypothetical protein
MHVRAGNITVEGTSQKSIFEQLAAAQQVFSESACGKCVCKELG